MDARRRIGQTHGLLAKDSILNTAENRGDHLETEVSLDGFPRCLTMKKAVRVLSQPTALASVPNTLTASVRMRATRMARSSGEQALSVGVLMISNATRAHGFSPSACV